MDRNGHTGSNGSRRIKIQTNEAEGMDSQIIPQLSPQWPQTFAKSMDIYSHSPSSGRIIGVGSSSFQNESLFSSFEHLPEANGMENSSTGLKEPLLIQRKRHPQEEYEENEYWGNHTIGIVEHANNEKTDEGSTFLRASLNGMNVLAGVGILSTPYALSEGGWLGLSILFIFSAICCYTGILLKRCMETNTQIRSYPDIGQAAFGEKGRIIVSIFLYVELYAVTVEFLILEGDNLAQLFPKVALEFAGIRINSQQSFILLSAFVILPTVYLRNLSLLAYISASGVAASVLVVLAVGWVGVFDGVGFHLSSPVLEVPRIEVKHDRSSFSRFLHPVSLSDIRFYGRFSYLCNRAYSIPEIKPEDLLKNYGLHFITSSLEKKAEVANKAKESMISDKSSTTSSPGLKENSVSSKAKSKSGLPINPAVAYRVAATAASYLHSQTRYILPFKSMHRNTTVDDKKLNNGTGQDVKGSLNSELVEITTASHAKITTLDPEAAPGCEIKPKSINCSIEIDECSELSSLSESEVASYIATSSVTAVVAAEEETKQAVANDLQSIHSSPCEWFICDDKSTCTRLFIIQGSDSLASWQANLFFEPIKFEGSEVFVHRGIYEAAKGIYEQILPEVHAHLKTCGEASRFRFTGHSLGGSLSVLLNLMLLIRGVVPLSSLLPVITFGSPCIMCGGDYLLEKLGLSTSHVQSIIMHRDIVPRAFSCHYPDHIAQILKRLNANFRNHPCLDSQRLLYAPVGQLLILQPDDRVSPTHYLLPTGCALYVLGHFMSTEIASEPSRAVQLRAAQIEFLNSPHPLETLSDLGAYGLKGSICRDHDSRNYLKTITAVLRHELKRLRRLERAQRRQICWPLVITESSMTIQRSSKASIGMPVHRISRESIGMGSKKFVGAVSSISSVSYEAPRRFEFPVQIGVLLRRSKATLGRFTRLVASQHMQMGLLFLLSGRMLIVQICGKIYS